MKVLDIKGIIFDYGGTLDTRGDHWSEVLAREQMIATIQKLLFITYSLFLMMMLP